MSELRAAAAERCRKRRRGERVESDEGDCMTADLCDVHTLADAYLADHWRDIATAPRDGTEFLWWRNGEICQAGWMPDWMHPEKQVLGRKGWRYPEWDMPTHYMPLPEPPNASKVEETGKILEGGG